MSDRKRQDMFAKLAQQHAKASQEPAATVEESPVEATPPSPAPAEPVKTKPQASRRKAEAVSGKRNNPDYCQANAYVLKTLRKAVDRELVDIDGLDYSSLIEDLLRQWLKKRGVSA